MDVTQNNVQLEMDPTKVTHTPLKKGTFSAKEGFGRVDTHFHQLLRAYEFTLRGYNKGALALEKWILKLTNQPIKGSLRSKYF